MFARMFCSWLTFMFLPYVTYSFLIVGSFVLVRLGSLVEQGIRVLVQSGWFAAETDGLRSMDDILALVHKRMRETCSQHGFLSGIFLVGYRGSSIAMMVVNLGGSISLEADFVGGSPGSIYRRSHTLHLRTLEGKTGSLSWVHVGKLRT